MSRVQRKSNRRRISKLIPIVISQQVRELYRDELRKTLANSCLLAQESLTVVLEDSLTQAEYQLIQAGKAALSGQVHKDLYESIGPQSKGIFEGALLRTVVDILSDTNLETGRTDIIFMVNQVLNVSIFQCQFLSVSL